MTFIDATLMGCKRTFDFTGRSTRWEYFYWMLFATGVSVMAGSMDAMAYNRLYGPDNEWGLFRPIANAILFVPGLSIMTRRIRDTGRDPKFWLLLPGFLVAVAVAIYLGGDAPAAVIVTFLVSGILVFLGAVVVLFLPTKEEKEGEIE